MSRKKYEMTIIRIGKNEHNHRIERTDSTYFKIVEKIQGEDKNIEFGLEDLYEKKEFFLSAWFSLIFSGIVAKYFIIIDNEGNVITETKPSNSGKLLKVARDWKGLDKAIKTAFMEKFDLPRWGFLVVIVIAIVVLFLLLKSGWIPLPEGWNI